MKIVVTSNVDIGEMLGPERKAELEIRGTTLRDLLREMSSKAPKKVEILNPRTAQIDWDCNILVNATHYDFLPKGLDAELKEGDQVHIELLPLGGG